MYLHIYVSLSKLYIPFNFRNLLYADIENRLLGVAFA